MGLRKATLIIGCIILICLIWLRTTVRDTETPIDNVITPTISTITPTVTETPEPTIAPTPTPVTKVETITYYSCPLSHDLQDYIRTLCEERGVPMSVIIAMIDKESTFRPEVISKTNDYGLMQINICNHDWLADTYGITDFLDPEQNVFCGISILAGHLANYEDITKALMAYNMGATGAKNAWDKGIYSTSYTETVLAIAAEYEQTTIENERSSK